jgi:oligopeptide transport system substrate-binding protein
MSSTSSSFHASRRTVLLGATAASLAACSRAGPPPGLLRVASSAMPDSLDPARGQFASAALVYKQIYAGLTDYGPDGMLAPGLAEHWTVSDDGLVWTFTLRENLRWSDGMVLTAEDIVWSAQRIVDPTQSFAILGDFFAVQNARAILAGDSPASTLGAIVLDARRVEFRLTTPLGLFPILMREFYPFPRHVIDRYGIDWVQPENIVTSGAYTVTQQTQNGIRLTKNPYYHAAVTVDIDAIQLDAVRDASTRVRLFRADDYDLADAPPTNQIAFLRDRLGDRFRSFDAPILRYLKLNHARPGLDNEQVREALSLAIDRDFIAREFFSDTARPTTQIIPGTHSSAPDIERAEALLTASGQDIGNLHFEIRTSIGEGERMALAIADDWSRVGVESEIYATYPTDLYQAVDNGAFDVAISSFNRGLKSDPFFMLDPFGPNGFAANFNWNDAQFADLMDQARTVSDPMLRAAVYQQAEARLLDQAALIPLLHDRAHWLVGSRVAGTRPDVQPMLWRDLDLLD